MIICPARPCAAVFQVSHGQALVAMRSEYLTVDAISEEREKFVRPGMDPHGKVTGESKSSLH